MHTLILKKTVKGLEALRARDPSLPQRLRPAFILFDGQKSIAQVMELLPSNRGRLQVLEDIKLLTQQGMLELLRPAATWSVESDLRLSSPDNEPFTDSAYADSTFTHSQPNASAVPSPSPVDARIQASRHASTPAQVSNPEARYMQGYAMASQLVSELGLKGFRLQLSVEKAQSYQGLVALLPRMNELIDAKKMRPLEKILLAPDSVSVPASNAPSPAIIP
ncbi:MAG: hypothetical protein RSD57_01895 [Comamonas sp.]